MYELYVPLKDGRGEIAAVVELYEVRSVLDSILLRNVVPPMVIPGVLLVLLILALTRLVGRAQRDIDRRTETVAALRRRLESFLSDTAVVAARHATDGAIPSRRLECSVVYTDIRDFTGFSEEHPPEQVVEMLNTLLEGQVRAIRNHGGDVDKFIGDAVMAWFHGADAAARAVRAAKEMLASVPLDAPRRVGVGVYSGPAVSGAVGPPDRRDFTLIGGTVNMAAAVVFRGSGRRGGGGRSHHGCVRGRRGGLRPGGAVAGQGPRRLRFRPGGGCFPRRCESVVAGGLGQVSGYHQFFFLKYQSIPPARTAIRPSTRK